MLYFPPTTILRHKKENLKKCSLRGLEDRSDLIFLLYPLAELPDLTHYIILTLDAPPLTHADSSRGIFLIDGTWRYAKKMAGLIPSSGEYVFRSLPSHYRTAYPRRQTDCPDPERGLASIEALYIAYQILGRKCNDLLTHYRWKDSFLQINRLAPESPI